MRWKGDKAKCWELVRKIVAKRDGDQCYTCPKKGAQWKWDAGHYYPVAIVGSNNKLSWDLRFIHRQCSYCNGPGQGMQLEYTKRLTEDYGEAVVAYFEANRRKINPIKNWAVHMQELKQELAVVS